jgi:hypothetical protein
MTLWGRRLFGKPGAAFVAVGFALGGARADELRIPLDTREAFIAYVAPLLQQRLSGYSVAPDVGMASMLVVDPEGAKVGHLTIQDQYQWCRAKPSACQDYVARWLVAANGAIDEYASPPDPQKLRVMIGPRESFVAEAAPRATTAPPLLLRPCVGEFVCVLVAEHAESPRYLDARDLERLKLTEDQAFDLGMDNLRRGLKPVSALPVPTAQHPIQFINDNALESSRLLFVADWAPLAERLGGELLVAIPAANLAVYTGGGSAEAVSALRKFAESATPSAERPLATTVLRWSARGWEAAPVALASGDGVYHCVDAKGVSVLSDTPCAADAQAVNIPHTAPSYASTSGPTVPGPAAGAVTGPQPIVPQSARASPQEITELRTDVLTTGGGGSDQSLSLETFAALELRVIAPNDPTWKRDNPRWVALFNVIRQDLNRDLQPAIRAQMAENARLLDDALASHLPAREVGQLLAFYRSGEGRRYMAFQQRLGVIQAQGMTQLTVGLVGGAMEPGSSPRNLPSQKILDERRRLLANSWISLLVRDLTSTVTSTAPRSDSQDEAIMGSMLDVIAKTHGPELDALQREYGSDLPHFDAFQEAPAVKSLISAFKVIAKQTAAGRPGTPDAFKAALDRSIAAHTASWKTAYEAGRLAAAASPQPPGPATAQSPSSQGQAAEASGKVVSTFPENANPLKCLSIDRVNSMRTPPELYGAVTDCIRHDRYPDGLALFALAGMYSQFDAARVADQTAGQAGQVLIMGMFSSLPPETGQKFQAAASALTTDKTALKRICDGVQRVGPPTYYPEYMVAHGIGAVMGALSGTQQGPALEQTFDGPKTWAALRTSYLNCPADGKVSPIRSADPATQLAPSTVATSPGSPPNAGASGGSIANAPDDSDEAQARCHPHLLRSVVPMPQIDVSGLADPSIGHIKIHFWVNGAGVVTRDQLTSATFGTPAERQAEVGYLKTLTFSVPKTPECRDREMELIGDVFVSRGATAEWVTLVRLYPRNVFVAPGALRRSD